MKHYPSSNVHNERETGQLDSYIEAEKDFLADWPKEPDNTYARKQYYHLAKKVIENIRRRSIREGISPDAYGRSADEARGILDYLRGCLGTEKDITFTEKKFKHQMFWEHKQIYSRDLRTGFHSVVEVWPIDKYTLISGARNYLENPYMQDDELDYLLTDALIYAEILAFQQQLSWGRSAVLFGIKWSLIILALFSLYLSSKEAFLLLGMAMIAYQAIKALKQKNPWTLHEDMLHVYFHCQEQYYNPSVIWDMCKVVRDKWAVFDGVTYDLLQRQIAKAAAKGQMTC